MTNDLDLIEQRLASVRQQIQAAAAAASRDAGTVQLLAVSKTRSADYLRAAFALGQRAFGENYLQEAREKQAQLADLDIEWHFIGPIQSNKTREIAGHFDWVHSVDRLKIAQRLSQQRPDELKPLNLCLQVNIDDEDTKSGVDLAALPELVAAIRELPRLQLRGLMAIPAISNDYDQQLATFAKLKQAADELGELDTLSMGMSGDLEAAIAAGSTIVRVGTALFGKRQVK